MEPNSLRAEAAYYALLRRISPSLRHRFVGRLQPIGLTAALAAKQLSPEKLNSESARASLGKVNTQAREAMLSAIETLAWLTGEETNTVDLQAGVEANISLIRTDCGMRGVSIVSAVTASGVEVPQRALRVMLTAVLITLVDMPQPPSKLEVSAVVTKDSVELHIQLHAAGQAEARWAETGSRKMRWEDVEALAVVEDVRIAKTVQAGVVSCRFAIAGERHAHITEHLMAPNP